MLIIKGLHIILCVLCAYVFNFVLSLTCYSCKHILFGSLCRTDTFILRIQFSLFSKSRIMSKKKSQSPVATAKIPTTAKASNKVKEAKETKKFFYVFAIATLLLVAFLYFIMMR